jgi:8-amino-7-oxononanoate synthase
MIDFTSALYLGLQHPSISLPPWDALTLGRPAALAEPPEAEALAAEIASLQGCEAGTLLPSTLHLFWDLFRVLDDGRVGVLCDAGLYPIARWGVERASSLGMPVHTFAHHDVGALEQAIGRLALAQRRPIVVTDGFCPSCGAPAPIRAYAELARRAGGWLVLDDTQALGILGEGPIKSNPYGIGGGGSLRWHGVYGPHIIVGSSLAKGFGAPLATLCGGRALIERFRDNSEARIHCSPPPVATIHAARQALRLNRRHGETLRRRLLGLVLRLRRRLAAVGLKPVGGLPFPVQSFDAEHSSPIARVFRWLRHGGVRALLTRGCEAAAARLTFLVTARHGPADIDAVARMAAAAGRPPA